MPRVKPHSHPCADCKRKTPCDGTWEENYDGSPEVVCDLYHMKNGHTDPDWVCDDCQLDREYKAIEEAKGMHGV